eukprot:gb/GECG01003695.1/.p1 GENE.gb/GECG01003695.1/~~gb/GECG01003695.1/.p1  ORF type:complete len:148 (+),score=15.11 gb/GECG01003695.1/:1-444(+)
MGDTCFHKDFQSRVSEVFLTEPHNGGAEDHHSSTLPPTTMFKEWVGLRMKARPGRAGYTPSTLQPNSAKHNPCSNVGAISDNLLGVSDVAVGDMTTDRVIAADGSVDDVSVDDTATAGLVEHLSTEHRDRIYERRNTREEPRNVHFD